MKTGCTAARRRFLGGQVTGLSGRGVGVDAVYTKVRALGGAMDIRSVPGRHRCSQLSR
jgi:hypothetical protein